MTLKADMARDIGGVFLNLDDFAETLRVGGKMIKCVFYEGSDSTADDDYGRSYKLYTMHAETRALPPLRVGDTLVVDNKTYTVNNVREDYGMTTLEIYHSL